MCPRYLGSTIYIDILWKNLGKSYREELQGVATTPLVVGGLIIMYSAPVIIHQEPKGFMSAIFVFPSEFVENISKE